MGGQRKNQDTTAAEFSTRAPCAYHPQGRPTGGPRRESLQWTQEYFDAIHFRSWGAFICIKRGRLLSGPQFPPFRREESVELHKGFVRHRRQQRLSPETAVTHWETGHSPEEQLPPDSSRQGCLDLRAALSRHMLERLPQGLRARPGGVSSEPLSPPLPPLAPLGNSEG